MTDDDLEIRMARNWARVFALHHRAQVKDGIEARGFDVVQHTKTIGGIYLQDDRVTGILMYSYFDRFLLDWMTQQLGKRGGELLERSRPLYSSYPRLLIAQGFGWIAEEIFVGLNFMRKIRNEFAHNLEVGSFDHPLIKGWIACMPKADSMMYDGRESHKRMRPRVELSTRDVFLMRATYCVSEGVIQVLCRPAFIKAGFGPEGLHMDEPSTLPSVVKKLMASAVHLMSALCLTSEHAMQDRHLDRWDDQIEARINRTVASFDHDMRLGAAKRDDAATHEV